MTTKAASAATVRKRRSTMAQKESIEGYLYISPWALGFLFFSLIPFVSSLVLSLTDYRIISKPVFVGLANYRTAFFEDSLFWSSLKRTFYYASLSVPVGIVGSLVCAMLLNQGLHGTSLYRTMYFLPSLTPIISSALLWKWILQPQFGVLNYLLGKIGIQGPGWLGSTEWAIPGLIVMALWGSVGGGRMIIFLAGLQGVPQELYEAAEIDGAATWHKFLHITLPMISPTMFFNLVLGVVGALQTFAPAYVATDGGPAYATWFYVLHLYYQAFKYTRMGYGCTLAWLFFILVIALTLVQLKLSRGWVYYAGEVR